MRFITPQLAFIVFIFLLTTSTFAEIDVSDKNVRQEDSFISLDENNDQGNEPVIHFFRCHSEMSKGAILLLSDDETEKKVQFLNNQQYDVALFEKTVSSNFNTEKHSILDVLKACREIKFQLDSNTSNSRFVILGIGSGGALAAKTVQRLSPGEQPDDLILISPLGMDETVPGTVYPAIVPPVQPIGRLWMAVSEQEEKSKPRIREYMKTWGGYDGKASFQTLTDTAINLDIESSLANFLKSVLGDQPKDEKSEINPAAVPVEGYAKDRHAAKLALVANNKYDLIFIGNSITHNFEKLQYQPVWNQFFAPRNALNLGTSGYRTENLIWNLQNGELDGQSPKVVVLHIGTNNIDEKNYPTRHTAGQLAGGIEKIVSIIRDKLPDAKIILLRCFPGCYGGPNPTSHRAILERASDIVSKLADNKHIFYCDVNHVFLNMDGSINNAMMPDWLHPSPAGAKAWAQAMEPLLSELMGDQSKDNEISGNTAVVPVSKLENDSYNWWGRHADVLQMKDSINPEIVMIGNSITHFWGGLPALKYADGKPRNSNGPNAWNSVFGDHRVLNLGFGWDRTQNVLWRLDHGELDGLHPRKVIIHIGTNNTSETVNARMNTATEIVEGIGEICKRVRSKVPTAEIILMAVMPREQSPDHPRRLLINEINKKLTVFANTNGIRLVDIGPKMLATDGTLSKEISGDFCHPSEKGYQIWADEIRLLIAK